jgi:preprotein translocase subunit YajC
MPTLNAPAYKQVDVGAAFGEAQYMSGVKANDSEDGDITGKTTHSSPVNTAVEGYYAVNYTVTDSDGNTATATTIVFVGKDWVFGLNYAIRAYDFSKSAGQVLGTDAEMISSARAQAIGTNQSAADFGKQVAVSVVNNGGYPAKKVGSYDITFAVQAEVGTTKTIKATVTGGNVPVLTVPGVRTVPASGGSFNYMQGVTANDAEDGNITNKVIHGTPVNMNNPGAYKVTYSVTDSDGNTVQKSGIVLVGTGWVVKGGYALYAEDFARKLSAIAGTSSEATRLSKAMAVWIADSSSADFGKYVPTKIAKLGGYKKAKGTYNITFAIAEKTSVTKTIKASISDDTPKAPIVQVTNRTIYNNRTTPAPNVTVNPPAVTVNNQPADITSAPVAEAPEVTEEAPTVEEAIITDSNVAKTSPESNYWYLFDVLLPLASLILGFYLMIVALRRREEENEDDEQSVNQGKQIRMWGGLGISLGIVSIIIMILTQHFEGAMKMVDIWTILFAVIFVAEVLAAFGVNSKKKDEWDGERDL